MTALRFFLTSHSQRSVVLFRQYTTPSSVRTGCSSVRSLLPSHTPDFLLSANFGAGFPDPFPTSGRCARTVSPNSTNFPRYGPPMARWNGDCTSPRKRCLSHTACRTIRLIKTLSADGLYRVCSCIAAIIIRTCPCSCFRFFRLLHCFDVTVCENFESLFALFVWT